MTDRDIRQHTGYLDQTEAFKAMSEPLITVTPTTDIREAARLLRERKIGALPVVEDGKLVGVITTDDVLEALTQVNRARRIAGATRGFIGRNSDAAWTQKPRPSTGGWSRRWSKQ